jgi:hypothetical protein
MKAQGHRKRLRLLEDLDKAMNDGGQWLPMATGREDLRLRLKKAIEKERRACNKNGV